MNADRTSTRVTLCTANTPGAVAILRLAGPGVFDTLTRLTGRDAWPERRACLCRFAAIDEGLALRLNAEAAQLMPHGGPRVVQKLIEHLIADLGCAYEASPDIRAMYPEADSLIEADVLDAIARAASPAAIDLLAAQPALWRSLLQPADSLTDADRQSIFDRSYVLDRLIHPPAVVVVGPPNAGKSTLTNALLGKPVSIVTDQPGTTRDWVGALVELSTTGRAQDAVAVQWLDTPGLRNSDDMIEQRAIALAKKQIEQADVLIAMRAVDQDWPDTTTLLREPDLWVVNKVDEAEPPSDSEIGSRAAPLAISAQTQRNLDQLQSRVIDRLRLSESAIEPWAFSERLRIWCETNTPQPLTEYLGLHADAPPA